MPLLNEEKIKSFFDDPFDQPPAELEADLPVFMPEEPEADDGGQLAVDVLEDGENYYIRALLAGVKSEDLDVTYADSVVTIRGSRQAEREYGGKDYLYQECFWGGFSRSVALPAAIDAGAIEANLKNGILTVRLPKL